MHRLQPCQLGNDSLRHHSYTLFEKMRGGASLCEPFEIPGGFWAAPVVGVSGMAATGRMWAKSQKTPLSVGGSEPATR